MFFSVSCCLQSNIQHESFPESLVHPAQAIQVRFQLWTLCFFSSLIYSPSHKNVSILVTVMLLQVGLVRQLLEQEPQCEQEARPAAKPQLQELGAPISVRRLSLRPPLCPCQLTPTSSLNPSSLFCCRSYHSSSRSSSRGRSRSRSSRYS